MGSILTCFLALIMTFSLQGAAQSPLINWYSYSYPQTVINTLESNGDDFYVFLSNGTTLKLRAVLYFAEQGDYPKNWAPIYYLARKEFASLEDLFSSEGLRFKQVFGYEKGHTCQILLPSNVKGSFVPSYLYTIPHHYKKFHDYWCWSLTKSTGHCYLCGNYKTIPLNFHDTSVNLGPLRVNLFEHGSSRYFYSAIPMPYDGDEYDCSPQYAHLIEAELLEFHDEIQNITCDSIKLKLSLINALVLQPNTLEWKEGDHLLITYEDQGLYMIKNLSKSSAPIHVYLADDAYSDLRNYPIFKENGFK